MSDLITDLGYDLDEEELAEEAAREAAEEAVLEDEVEPLDDLDAEMADFLDQMIKRIDPVLRGTVGP